MVCDKKALLLRDARYQYGHREGERILVAYLNGKMSKNAMQVMCTSRILVPFSALTTVKEQLSGEYFFYPVHELEVVTSKLHERL